MVIVGTPLPIFNEGTRPTFQTNVNIQFLNCNAATHVNKIPVNEDGNKETQP
eukprot:m.168311 g.168311  ORF g.168311 m.168311 type:complete len:52 (+) comp31509_c1_seq3:1278-1433(+)